MKRLARGCTAFLLAVLFLAGMTQSAWPQAKGHASVGMGRGEEGYLALKEMVKHLEFSLKMKDASPEMKIHLNFALKHAREALLRFDEALRHTNESLGRPARNPLAGGSGAGMEGSHDDGGYSVYPPGPPMGMEGSHMDGSHNDGGYGVYPPGPPMGMPEGSH